MVLGYVKRGCTKLDGIREQLATWEDLRLASITEFENQPSRNISIPKAERGS
jgi:hypothetical protein